MKRSHPTNQSPSNQKHKNSQRIVSNKQRDSEIISNSRNGKSANKNNNSSNQTNRQSNQNRSQSKNNKSSAYKELRHANTFNKIDRNKKLDDSSSDCQVAEEESVHKKMSSRQNNLKSSKKNQDKNQEKNQDKNNEEQQRGTRTRNQQSVVQTPHKRTDSTSKARATSNHKSAGRSHSKRKKLNIIEMHQQTKEFQDTVVYDDELEEAMKKLGESYQPETILCRNNEQETIKSFIQDGIDGYGQSQSLYISGVPGLGKTACIIQVINELLRDQKKNEAKGKAPKFSYHYLNALKLAKPDNIYTELAKEFTNKAQNPYDSCKTLEFMFRNKKLPAGFYKTLDTSTKHGKKRQTQLTPQQEEYNREIQERVNKTKLLIIDELDYLYTKDQNVLYNIFEWPHHRNSGLIIIGIANTLDLPEKLMARISSRMGNRRLIFTPYSSSDIKVIIQQRIQSIKAIFDQNAITYISKKIAAVSSDIRKTLSICRKAVEILQEKRKEDLEAFKKEQENNPGNIKTIEVQERKITIDLVVKTFDEAYSSPVNEYVKTSTTNIKAILFCIFQESRSSAKVIEVQSLLNRFIPMSSSMSLLKFSYQQFLNILQKFSQVGILEIKENCKNFRQEIHLSVEADELGYALKDESIFKNTVHNIEEMLEAKQ